MKNNSFLSENFQLLEVIFSIYLNRRVFVMSRTFMQASSVSAHNIYRLANISKNINGTFSVLTL